MDSAPSSSPKIKRENMGFTNIAMNIILETMVGKFKHTIWSLWTSQAFGHFYLHFID